MEIKSIKGVDDYTWQKFKSLAVESNLTMPSLLKIMVNEFKRNNENSWNKLLSVKRVLNDEEADELLGISKKIRKEKGFRI